MEVTKVLAAIADCLVVLLILFLLASDLSSYVFKEPMVAVVNGVSMEPLLRTGDIVLINPFDKSPHLGSVIVFLNDLNQMVIHRVVAIIVCSNGMKLYVTKGDNDFIIDPEDIAISKSISCKEVKNIVALNEVIKRDVEQCLRGLSSSDIVGDVVEIDGGVLKIFGLSIQIG